MSHYIKRSGLFVLIFSLMLLLVACNTSDLSDQNGSMVYSWEENRIEIEDVTFDDYTQENPINYYNMIKVSGLQNKEVEEKINTRLSDAFYAAKDGQEIPPYRGILVNINADTPIISQNIYMYSAGNFNNILSIVMNVNEQRGDTYYSFIQTYNFDLNTGEELKLSDVFTSSFDYENAINENIKNYLIRKQVTEEGFDYYTGVDYVQIEPFKGLRENTKFYLSEDGITLLFDYEYPEFYLYQYYPVHYFISYFSFPEQIALKEKYQNEDNTLYQKIDPISKILVQSRDIVQEAGWIGEDIPENVYLECRYDYAKTTPENVIDLIKSEAYLDESERNRILEASQQDPEYYLGLSKQINCTQTGRYFSLMTNQYTYLPDYWMGYTTSRIFDLEGNPVDLDRLFIEDFDYQSIILKSLKEEMENYQDMPYYEKDYVFPYTAEALYDTLTFSLSRDALYCYSESIEFDMGGGESDYQSDIFVRIPYTDFGCDNMTIFD